MRNRSDRIIPKQVIAIAEIRRHPEQQQTYLPDGRLRLSFPYTDHRELLRDLLRFSGEVEVLEPIELRSMMISTLHQGLEKYQEKE